MPSERPRRRSPARPAAESTRALLVRFCRWAQTRTDLGDGEEAFVDTFLRETFPFGRRIAAPGPTGAPADAPQTARQPQQGLPMAEAAPTPPPRSDNAAAGRPGDQARSSLAALAGVLLDRILKE